MMFCLVVILLFVAAVPVCAPAQDPVEVRRVMVMPAGGPVDSLVKPDGSSWGMKPGEFMAEYRKLGFRWTSAAEKTSARASGVPITYADSPVMEAIVHFKDGGMSEVILSIYNRGDAGEMPKDAFVKLVGDLQKKLSDWTGKRPSTVSYRLETAGVKKDARAWKTDGNQLKLEWSYSTGGNKKGFRFRSEYIRLQMQSASSGRNYASSIQAKQKAQGTVSRSMMKSRVRTEPQGDIYIEGVPMVDQGQKGYCVVATMERIMRYYGRDVDQHEMAQIAQTKTTGGTSMELMVDALRLLGLKLGCKVVIHEDWDWKSFQRFIGDYNRVARKDGAAQINIPTSGTIYINKLYEGLQPEPWKTARMKKKADFSKFKSTISKYVKQGIPLPWTVYTGVFPEEPELRSGGSHMRMIIGYNTKTAEVIYTDSWGAGHEKKRMSMENAWTMTDGLYTVEPRQMKY